MTHETEHPDGLPYRYACQHCGAPYTSEPKFCYECKGDSIAPIADVL